MKTKGTRSRFADRLSPAERQQIIAWSREGINQREIASRLRCDPDTIHKWQVRLGVARPLWRKLDAQAEQEIFALAAEGLGYRSIAQITTIGKVRVHKFMRAHGLSQRTGGRSLPRKKRDAIDADLRGRVDFLCKIAKKHGVGLETVRRRKRVILGPAPLLSVWPPLQSKFSQKDAARFLPATPEQAFLCLISGIIDTVAEEYLRQGRNRDEVMAARKFLKSDPRPVLDEFDARLREAVAPLRGSQTDLVN